MDRVLAFGCHPDDVEFMCAGTLALLAEKGCEIHVATMTGGEVGSPSLTREQIRARRLQEAGAAAAEGVSAACAWGASSSAQAGAKDPSAKAPIVSARQREYAVFWIGISASSVMYGGPGKQ